MCQSVKGEPKCKGMVWACKCWAPDFKKGNKQETGGTQRKLNRKQCGWIQLPEAAALELRFKLPRWFHPTASNCPTRETICRPSCACHKRNTGMCQSWEAPKPVLFLLMSFESKTPLHRKVYRRNPKASKSTQPGLFRSSSCIRSLGMARRLAPMERTASCPLPLEWSVPSVRQASFFEGRLLFPEKYPAVNSWEGSKPPDLLGVLWALRSRWGDVPTDF